MPAAKRQKKAAASKKMSHQEGNNTTALSKGADTATLANLTAKGHLEEAPIKPPEEEAITEEAAQDVNKQAEASKPPRGTLSKACH